MNPDITRTWAGVAIATDRIGYNGERLTRDQIAKRERENHDALLTATAHELRAMTPEARDRRIASMREQRGDTFTDNWLAQLRAKLRQEKTGNGD